MSAFTAVQDFVATDMARQSGFAQLAQRALTVPLEPGVASVKIPSRASPLTLMGSWIGETNAKPVHSGTLTATTLASYKLAALSVFTEEMLASSAIEAIVREELAHNLSVLLDTALFDAAAGSSVRPAGLFNGATTVTASAATLATEAMHRSESARRGGRRQRHSGCGRRVRLQPGPGAADLYYGAVIQQPDR